MRMYTYTQYDMNASNNLIFKTISFGYTYIEHICTCYRFIMFRYQNECS